MTETTEKSARTPGQALHESLRDSAVAEFGLDIEHFEAWDQIRQSQRNRLEAAAQAAAGPVAAGLRRLVWDMLDTMPASAEALSFAVRGGQLGVCDPAGNPLIPACAPDPDDDDGILEDAAAMDDDLSADPFTVAREDGDWDECEPML